MESFVEALVGPGLGLDEVEVKNAGTAAAAAAMRVVVLLILALAGLFTPPSGHVLNYTKHNWRRGKEERLN